MTGRSKPFGCSFLKMLGIKVLISDYYALCNILTLSIAGTHTTLREILRKPPHRLKSIEIYPLKSNQNSRLRRVGIYYSQSNSLLTHQ